MARALSTLRVKTTEWPNTAKYPRSLQDGTHDLPHDDHPVLLYCMHACRPNPCVLITSWGQGEPFVLQLTVCSVPAKIHNCLHMQQQMPKRQQLGRLCHWMTNQRIAWVCRFVQGRDCVSNEVLSHLCWECEEQTTTTRFFKFSAASHFFVQNATLLEINTKLLDLNSWRGQCSCLTVSEVLNHCAPSLAKSKAKMLTSPLNEQKRLKYSSPFLLSCNRLLVKQQDMAKTIFAQLHFPRSGLFLCQPYRLCFNT